MRKRPTDQRMQMRISALLFFDKQAIYIFSLCLIVYTVARQLGSWYWGLAVVLSLAVREVHWQMLQNKSSNLRSSTVDNATKKKWKARRDHRWMSFVPLVVAFAVILIGMLYDAQAGDAQPKNQEVAIDTSTMGSAETLFMWRWTHHIMLGFAVPRLWWNPGWNTPGTAAELYQDLQDKIEKSPDEARLYKKYDTRTIDIAYAKDATQKRTFRNYEGALEWLEYRQKFRVPLAPGEDDEL